MLGILPARAGGRPLGETLPGEQVERFTGGHTRVVWVTDDYNKDTFADYDALRLAGYDSRDGKGARYVLNVPSNYHVPLITPDGQRIVFSNKRENQIYVVNWDGTELKKLKHGVASDLWLDPASHKVWVYAQRDVKNHQSPIVRFLLDHPSTEETVWSSSPVQAVSGGGFQVSRDGRRAAATFPWPNSGMAELPDVAWRKHRDGCWPSMAPDNSYMFWTFDGPHKNLLMTKPGAEKTWSIPVSTAPGINNYEVYHPRWSNDVRYMVMSGPYTTGSEKIKLWNGADGVELHIGRFNDSFTAIEKWLKLTSGNTGEFFPDVWIEGGGTHVSKFAQAPKAEQRRADGETTGFSLRSLFSSRKAPSNDWPGSRKGLIFLWKSNKDANEFVADDGGKVAAGLVPQGSARFGPNDEMHLIRGGFASTPEVARQIQQACMKTNELSIEAVITSSSTSQTGPARIISMSQDTKRRNFTLGQEGDRLVLRLQTSKTNANGTDFTLARLNPGTPQHVVVTYKRGRLTCYVDGVLTNESDFEKGDFRKWKDYALILGQEHDNRRHWDGYLEYVALYSRAMTPHEAFAKSKVALSQIARRQTIATSAVKAEMLSKHEPPAVETIAPYRRALAINRYKIIEAPDHSLVGDTIHVAEWALLDAQVPSDYQNSRVGTIRRLELQPYDAHPQLESERLVSDSPPLEESLHYHVGSGRE